MRHLNKCCLLWIRIASGFESFSSPTSARVISTFAEVPDIAEGLKAPAGSLNSLSDAPFQRLLSAGNPWRKSNTKKRMAEGSPLSVRYQLG